MGILDKIMFMKFQTLEEFQNVTNNTNLDGFLIYVANISPTFIPWALFSLFIVTLLPSYFIGLRLTGRSDFPASLAVSSFFVTIIAFVMNTIDGLINITTIISTLAFTTIFVIIFFISRDR